MGFCLIYTGFRGVSPARLLARQGRRSAYCFAGLLQLLLSSHPDLLVHPLLHLSLEASQAGCLLPLMLLQLLLHLKC